MLGTSSAFLLVVLTFIEHLRYTYHVKCLAYIILLNSHNNLLPCTWLWSLFTDEELEDWRDCLGWSSENAAGWGLTAGLSSSDLISVIYVPPEDRAIPPAFPPWNRPPTSLRAQCCLTHPGLGVGSRSYSFVGALAVGGWPLPPCTHMQSHWLGFHSSDFIEDRVIGE